MEVRYDKIGTAYNNTRKADPYLTERLFFLLQPQSNKLYLDVGCGTGNYTSALADKGIRFTGADPSEKMLDAARARRQDINWIKATAEYLPFANKAFDGIIATLTLHHWQDIKKAFIELNRVLSDSGRLVLFTSTPEQMSGYWLNHYFSDMLHASAAQMPSLDDIQKAATEAKLEVQSVEKYFIRDDLRDCFLYVGKNKPEYYFDAQIRQGISSFSSLSNKDEIKQGLEKLRNDIEQGVFEKIRHRYENDSGDYLFVTIGKKGKGYG